MSLRNTYMSYGSVAKWLHWVTALLVIIMLIVGFSFDLIPHGPRLFAFFIHKSVGMLLLALVLVRIVWVLMNPRPALPTGMHKFEKFLAHLAQVLLYAALLTMTLSGWIFSTAAGYAPSVFGLFTVPAPFVPHDLALMHTFVKIHKQAAWVLLALIAFHAAGALKHHFINKDDVLKKMLPKRN